VQRLQRLYHSLVKLSFSNPAVWLKNAPALFQYIGDVSIFSQTVQEHVEHIGLVLISLQSAGLKLDQTNASDTNSLWVGGSLQELLLMSME